MQLPVDLSIPLDHMLPTADSERLTRLITALFEKWELSVEEKKKVLNKSFEDGDSWFTLSSEDIPRVTYLLTIHACLRLLFPRNPDMRYQWIKQSNRFFQQRTPLTVMIDDGIVGAEAVACYLQAACRK